LTEQKERGSEKLLTHPEARVRSVAWDIDRHRWRCISFTHHQCARSPDKITTSYC